jgi:beta-N-acetylhexosaminidase
MLFAGFDGLEPPDYILEMLRAGQLGGLVLFARNVATPDQLAALTAACHAAAPRPILIAIDQEGGRVARLRDGFSESPGAMALGAADSADLARQTAQVLAAELRALGINWNLAPVVDLAGSRENPVIGTRALGDNPERVAALAAAQIAGIQAEGVAATAKHFPGHGNTPTDTHVALAVVSGALDELWTRDLAPFRAVAAEVATVMNSHVLFETIDPAHPASLSRAVVTGLLRERIGFTGLTCTDCLEMAAIRNHYGPRETAVLAAEAGNDVLFFSHTRADQEAAFAALLDAAEDGRLDHDRIAAANARIAALCEQYPAAPGDLSAIGGEAHRATMGRAARAAVAVPRADAAAFPLNAAGQRVALVEFASYLETGAVESGGQTGLGARLAAARPGIERVSLKAVGPAAGSVVHASELAAGCDVLILATRNAHLWPDEAAIARDVIALAPRTILLCLSNPYDIALFPEVGTVLCTFGDGAPSLDAAVDALLGRYVPTATPPVPLV